MEIGDIIELVSGVMNATKSKEGGGFEIDRGKLAILGATFAGQQILNRWQEGRQQKVVRRAEKLGLSEKDLERLQKKKGHLGRNLLVVAGVGAAGYLLVMKPEQRAELFKNIDSLVNEAGELLNEIQGNPTSEPFKEGGV